MSELGSLDKISERVHIIHERLRNIKSLMTETMRDITWVESTLDRRLSISRIGDDKTVESELSSVKKQQTGLAKPVLISDEMCYFMGVSIGSKYSRVDVTRAVHEYIKTNRLQDSNDKRMIVPDETLGQLLATTEPIPYLMIQKYLKHHFPKQTQSSATITQNDEDNMPISELTDDEA